MALDTSGADRTGLLSAGLQHSTNSRRGTYAIFCNAALSQGVALPALPLPAQFSILVWMQSTSHLQSMPLVQLSSSTVSVQLSVQGGMPSFTMSWPGNTITVQNSQSSVLGVTDGLWHHVAVMVSADSATLYVNGAVDATTTLVTPFPTSFVQDNYIGKSNDGGSFYDGYVDDARIYLGTLTARELVRLVCKSHYFYHIVHFTIALNELR